MERGPSQQHRAAWLGLFVVLVVYFGVFGRCLSHEYVWDDVKALTDNPDVDRPLSETLLMSESVRIMHEVNTLQSLKPRHDSFRPLLFLSWVAQLRLVGRSPMTSHAVGLLLGAFNILLVFGIARRLFAATGSVWLATAVFALHPLQVEPICYSAARGDPLSALFALSAMLCVLRIEGDRAKPLAVAGAVVFYLLSLFVKEATIGLPLVMLGLALATSKVRAWRHALLALFAAVPCYFAMRFLLASDGAAVARQASLMTAIFDLPALFIQYLGVLAFPLQLSIDRSFALELRTVAWFVVGIPTLSTLWLLRSSELPESRRRGIGLALAGFATTFFLVSPAAVAVRSFDNTVADRYAYLGVLGFAIAMTSLGTMLFESRDVLRKLLPGAAAVWCALLVLLSFLQVSVWRDNGTLYLHSLEMEPGSSMAHYRVGYQLVLRGHRLESIDLFKRAIELGPNNERAYNNLGVVYLQLGRLDEAERVLMEIIRRKQGLSFRGLYNLALVLKAKGNSERACDAIKGSLEVNPSFEVAKAHYHEICGPEALAPKPK